MAPGDKNIPNQAPALLAVIWSLGGLSTIVMVLRLYTRMRIVARVAWDDYLMVVSWVCNMLFSSFLTVSAHFGLGKHIFDLDPYHAKTAMHWDFLAQNWGVMTPMFGRISFAVTLLNLVGTSKLKKNLLWAAIVTQVLAGVSTVILIYVQCGTKIAALWDPAVRAHANCWSPDVQTFYGFFQSSVNSVTDLFLTIMPTWILWNVQMKIRFKVALAILLGLSIVAMVASIVKTYELKTLGLRNDFTWNTPIFFIWVVVELNVVIIAASVPSLKPLFGKTIGTSRGKSYEMYGSTIRNNASEPNGYGSNSEHKAWAGSHKRHQTKETTLNETDASSEENILPLQLQSPYAIKKTTDVTVISSPPESRDPAARTHSHVRAQKFSNDSDDTPFPFAHPDDRV